jgi:hypothetical protein
LKNDLRTAENRSENANEEKPRADRESPSLEQSTLGRLKSPTAALRSSNQ